MSRHFIKLADAELLFEGDVQERRERIRWAGLAGDIRWARHRLRDGTVFWAQPFDWKAPIDWERSRLGSSRLLTGHHELVECLEVDRGEWLSYFGSATKPNSGGRPRKWDWEEFWLEVCVRVHEDGLPATQADMVGRMQEWFVQKCGDHPAESEIKRRLSKLWHRLGRG
jgi:hypothetical protein